MFCHQQRKIRILRLFLRILIAMTVYSNDAIGILRYNRSLGIHTEGSHSVPIFLGPVYDLTLIQLIRDMGKNFRRKFHPDSNIYAI